MADAALELVAAGDQGDAEAAAVGVFQLLAELLRVGKHLDADAGRPQRGRQPQIVVQAVLVEERNQHRGGRRNLLDHAQLFHRRQQPVEPQRGADARQLLRREQLGQIVVAAAGADAADAGQGVQETSRRSCRCSNPARGRSTDRAAPARLGTPAAAAPSSTSLSFATPAWPISLPATSGSTWRSTSSLPPAISESCSTCRACSAVAPATETISSATASGADLAEFVERPQNGRRAIGQPEPFQQAREHHAVVDADREVGETDRPEQIVDHQRGFDVGGDRAGADGVEIALHELAVAAALRVFAAPDRGDVVSLERHAQLVGVLRRRSGPAAPSGRIAARPNARRGPGTCRAACRSRRSPCRRGFPDTPSAGVSIGLKP